MFFISFLLQILKEPHGFETDLPESIFILSPDPKSYANQMYIYINTCLFLI